MFGNTINSKKWKEVLLDEDGRVLFGGVQSTNNIFTLEYDSIYAAYPSDTTEVYTTKSNGSIQEIVTVTYTSSSKSELLSVERQ